MNCKICQSNMSQAFSAEVISKYMVQYYKCNECGFLCTEEPYWSAEAYQSAITVQDTGLLSRNIDLSRKVAVLIYYLFNSDGVYLDYAGGYGVFTRLMRDAGFSFFHTDPHTENIFAKEFEWDGNVPIDGATCFECFEHLPHPLQTIDEIASIAKTIIFATVLLPDPVPDMSWDYYGFEHGQHISFYSHETLQFIADKLGVFLVSIGSLHIFSENKLDRRKVKRLMRKANRVHSLYNRKTTFEVVSKNMRHRYQGEAV